MAWHRLIVFPRHDRDDPGVRLTYTQYAYILDRRQGKATTRMAVDSLYKQRRDAGGRPFQKGQSGNLAGLPPGSRNRTTLAAEALLEGEA